MWYYVKKPSGGTDRPPTPADDIQPQQGNQGGTETSKELQKPIEGGQTSKRPTVRLLQLRGGTGWAGGQSLRRLRAED